MKSKKRPSINFSMSKVCAFALFDIAGFAWWKQRTDLAEGKLNRSD